jgi:hypothetical protein
MAAGLVNGFGHGEEPDSDYDPDQTRSPALPSAAEGPRTKTQAPTF